MKLIKYLLLLFYINACSLPVDQIKNVYENRNDLLNKFLSKSIMRSRGQNYILFYTHKNNKTNQYFLSDSINKFGFIRDSIEYYSDIMDLKSERGTNAYKQEVILHLKPLLNKMDSLGIRDIKGDLYGLGIDLKIYMKSKGVLLYVSDRKKITNSKWMDYISSMNKIDENWFYTLNE